MTVALAALSVTAQALRDSVYVAVRSLLRVTPLAVKSVSSALRLMSPTRMASPQDIVSLVMTVSLVMRISLVVRVSITVSASSTSHSASVTSLRSALRILSSSSARASLVTHSVTKRT